MLTRRLTAMYRPAHMKVPFANSSDPVTSGSLIGYLFASLDTLEKVLGAPGPGGDKTTFEWMVSFSPPGRAPFLLNIYDWKWPLNDRTAEYEWHIGGDPREKDERSFMFKTAGDSLGLKVSDY